MERIEREIASGRIAIPVVPVLPVVPAENEDVDVDVVGSSSSSSRLINATSLMRRMYRQSKEIIYSDLEDSNTSSASSIDNEFINDRLHRLHDQEDDDDDEDEDEDDDDGRLSQYSDCQSSEAAEWESYVDKNGDLIYIDCYPKCTKKPNTIHKQQSSRANNAKTITSAFFKRGKSRRSSKRSGGSKLLRLIKHNNKKPLQNNNNNLANTQRTAQTAAETSTSTSKVTFNDCEAGEQREVHLYVDPKNRIKYGRHVMTISESILGLTLGTFNKHATQHEDERIMIAGIVPDSEVALKHTRHIKIGDWLKQINNIHVHINNIMTILDNITKPQVLHLTLQRIAGCEVTNQPPPNIIPKQSKYIKLLNSLNDSYNEYDKYITRMLMVKHHTYITCMFINLAASDNDIVYCYPPADGNTRHTCYRTNGIYITLQHLLLSNINKDVRNTRVLYNRVVYNVVYTYESAHKCLLLLSLPDHVYNMYEASILNECIVRQLMFMYAADSLYECFNKDENHAALHHFFAQYFLNVLLNNYIEYSDSNEEVDVVETDNDIIDDDNEYQHINKLINILNADTNSKVIYYFDDLLPLAQHVLLPRDVQLDIDDCLNDMEACDYREWNEDPMDCQRLYTITGSCLYTNKYLLASHLNHVDLVDIQTYLHTNNVFNLFMNEALRTFILWRQIHPKSSINPFNHTNKYYLLIIGHQHDILCVVFESGGCTVQHDSDVKLGPDPFYVEEVQFTLNDIQAMGSIHIANKWMHSNLYPHININNKQLAAMLKQQPIVANKAIEMSAAASVSNLSAHTSLASQLNALQSVAQTTTTTTTTAAFSALSVGQSTSSTFARKPYEVTSILKRRTTNTSLLSLDPHTISDNDEEDDDADSRVSYQSAADNDNNEPQPHTVIVGRRKARERGVYTIDNDDNDNELAWNDDDTDSNSLSAASSCDLTDQRQLLMHEIDCMKPYKVTTSAGAGADNTMDTLYYYVQLDEHDGIMVCPPRVNNTVNTVNGVLNNFRRSCQTINKLFKKTVRYKNLLNHNNSDKPIINKSLVAIKEHAVLFECNHASSTTTNPAPSSAPPANSRQKHSHQNTFRYWVVGRLFLEPHPRELYICYDESIPQNIVEVAFRLGILEAG